MTFWVAGAVVVSSAIGASAAGDAADAQAGAAQSQVDSNRDIARMQIDANLDIFGRNAQFQREMIDNQIALQQPFRDIGLGAQNKVLEMLNGKYSRDFGMQDFQADPGYAFTLSEGLKALDRTAAARGGLVSGNSMKAAQKYGQGLASQEYQNAFNRYQTNRSNQLQPWQSLAGLAPTASNAISGAYGQMGNQMGNAFGQMGAANNAAYSQMGAGNASAYGNMGNARASGGVGVANAITGGIGNFMNYQNQQNMLNNLNQSSGNAFWNNQFGLNGNSGIGG